MKNKMPLGFKIILILLIISLILKSINLFNGNYSTFNYFGGYLPNNANFLIAIFYYLLDISMVISLIKRYSWGVKLFLVSGGLTFIEFLTAYYNLVIAYPSTFLRVAGGIIYLIFFASIAIITWYVYRNRSYFNK